MTSTPLSAQATAEGLWPVVRPRLRGTAKWEATADVAAAAGSGPGAVRLVVESDLRGLEVSLPAPLKKGAQERRALRDKVDATGGLAELERMRLHANLKWYLEVPPDMSWLRSRLKEVDAEHHLALRAAVVVIAHADSVIQSEEVACIEKIYKALGIDAGLVYADLHAGDVPDGPVRVRAAEAEAPGERIPAEPKARGTALDAARIAAIRTDTERVSSVLGEIFAADDDTNDEAAHAHKLPSSLAGLDHQPGAPSPSCGGESIGSGRKAEWVM